MSVYLATTAERDLWDTASEVVYLGDWCFSREYPRARAGCGALVVASPWKAPGFRDQAFQYLDALSERTLPALAGILNAHHGLAYDLRAWRILTGDWLLHATHALYDLFAHFQAALKWRPELATATLDLGPDQVPRTVGEFKERQMTRKGQLLLISVLAHQLREAGYGVFPRPIARLESSRVARPSAGGARLGKAAVRRLAFRLSTLWLAGGRRAPVVFWRALTHRDYPGLARGFGGRAVILEPPRSAQRPDSWPDMPRRATLFEGAGGRGGDEFERLLWNCLPRLLPTSFLEDFSWWSKEAERLPLRGIRHVFTALGFGGDELSGFWLSGLARRSVRVHGMQHGGGYGLFKYYPQELHERRCSDRYLTWGWKSDARDIPLPGLPLNRLPRRSRHATRVQRLLFVSSDRPNPTHRIQSHPLSGEVGDYFEWQRRFYRGLDADLAKGFCYRPFREDYGDETRHWYEDAIAPSAVDHERFEASVKKADVVVFDHNGTGFLQTLAANVPTVIYWNPAVWQLRESASVDLARLAGVGVFFEEPGGAAAHLSRIKSSLRAWWRSVKVQETVAAFCHRYARRAENPMAHWRRWLEGEAAGQAANATLPTKGGHDS